VRRFVKDILDLVGKPTDEIRFKRQSIANESETVSDIAVMRQDIDRRTALKLNPYIQEEEIEQIMLDLDAESVTGQPSIDELDKIIREGE
jgi:hypothetical protein